MWARTYKWLDIDLWCRFALIYWSKLCDGLALLPKKLKYPLNLDISGVKGKFQFMAPGAVKVVGSYLLGTMVKPHFNVDVALAIPVVSMYEECLIRWLGVCQGD